MENLKHTPGPWTCIFQEFGIKIMPGKGCKQIAVVKHTENHNIENIHNAKLISAAPEMLELLLHFYVNYELPYGSMDIQTKQRFKNVIEKATGMKIDGTIE